VQLANKNEGLPSGRGTIVLGVAASDAHVVANHLIAMFLRRQDFSVINLGACTPTEEFMKAASTAPNLVAVLIGSLNGHALEDLADLPVLRLRYQVSAPVLVGGNLSVGAIKSDDIITALLALGVDMVLQHPNQIVEALSILEAHAAARALAYTTVVPVTLLEEV
jgi:methylaspartate mutase sigma subunit